MKERTISDQEAELSVGASGVGKEVRGEAAPDSSLLTSRAHTYRRGCREIVVCGITLTGLISRRQIGGILQSTPAPLFCSYPLYYATSCCG